MQLPVSIAAADCGALPISALLGHTPGSSMAVRCSQFYVYHYHEYDSDSAHRCRGIFCGQASSQAQFHGVEEEEASRCERCISASDVRFCFFL